MCFLVFFFFKQKTAYEMRISDWSSDVCSSDLFDQLVEAVDAEPNIRPFFAHRAQRLIEEDGRIVGVLCDAGDEAITFRARKGVVLSCGGFEQTEEMILNHQIGRASCRERVCQYV